MKLLLTLACILVFELSIYSQTPQLHTYDIQGSGIASAFVGQFVSMEPAVVIASGFGFAYVQDPQGDGNANTSDGLLLSNLSLGQLAIGQLVTASGIVRELDGQTSIAGPDFSISIIGQQDLPEPVFLQVDADLDPVPDQEKFEGMRVTFEATVGGPSRSSDATIYTTDTRPMREPGIEAPGIANLPIYDGNPELIIYDPNGFGQADNRFLNAGASFNGQGVLFQDDCCYVLAPTAPVVYTALDPSTQVRARQADEITVGSLNLLNFNAEEEDYDTRLEKLSSYIEDNLDFPQILAVQEAWGIQELNALSFQLRQADPVNGDYRVYLGTGTGNISNGYLVSNNLPEPTISELGTNQFLSIGGILHDRPPMLLSLQLEDDNQTIIQVLNLHLRSLNGIEGSDSDFVRTKRYEQSISVAEMVENLRDENLILVGDFNAFEFSDGYVDVLSQISGSNTLGAQRPPIEIVAPELQNLTVDLLSAEDRYSFVFRGSAQMLDHCLANDLDGLSIRELQFGRGNADAAQAFAANQFSTLRCSDHDGFVLFLGVDALSSVETTKVVKPNVRFPNPFTNGDLISFPQSLSPSRVQIFDLMGRPVSSHIRIDDLFRLPQVGNPRVNESEDPAINPDLRPIEDGYSWRPNLSQLSSGVYFLRLAVGSEVYAWPMVIR